MAEIIVSVETVKQITDISVGVEAKMLLVGDKINEQCSEFEKFNEVDEISTKF